MDTQSKLGGVFPRRITSAVLIKEQNSSRCGEVFRSASPANTAQPFAPESPRFGDLRSTGSPKVAILTGGGDKPYALGIAAALADEKVPFDFIGSDELDVPEVTRNPYARFLNLRGDQNPNASAFTKSRRVLIYYLRLLRYMLTARPEIFHILWHNKFELFDRTILLFLYRLCGKRLVYTAHNVNTRARDGRDSRLNRWTLKLQYALFDHIFVHTQRMKDELVRDFSVRQGKVTVIPFGINATNPQTGITPAEARAQFGLAPGHKTVLFFGNIAPYKGLEYLLDAFAQFSSTDSTARLIIAGRRKCSEQYWDTIQRALSKISGDSVILRPDFIPDDQVEIYFKAADVLVLPYTEIFQSGVLFLGYNFGVPVIAADVGSLKEEIIEGETGCVFRPRDSADLGRSLKEYFSSPLYSQLEQRRHRIRDYANERYSWAKVACLTKAVYSKLLSH